MSKIINEGLCKRLVAEYFRRTQGGRETSTAVVRELMQVTYAQGWQAARTVPGTHVLGWQPIETAPKDRTRIMLGRAENGDVSAVSTVGWWQEAIEDGVDYMGDDGGFVDMEFQVFHPSRSFGSASHRYAASQPTHWMHLPAAPAGGETPAQE